MDSTRSADGVRRSLILAGGGMKVAFQAGVLQVWLDEAGLRFHHADGASGGVFNAAMWCQGMTGTEIADNWRNYNPWIAADLNWPQLPRLLWAQSFLRLNRLRRNVLPRWGIDFDQIRSSPRRTTFNVYNFTRQRLEAVPQDQLREAHLAAAVALPMWFPPVVIDGDTYIDAVFATDANIEEAIRLGARELWIIWTVSTSGEWHGGFVAEYFQMIEACANSRLQAALQRIDRSNAEIANGRPGEFADPIEVHCLRHEVDLHYLINFSRDRFAEAVNAGVEAARDWCAAKGIPVASAGGSSSPPVPAPPEVTTISFSEEMKGWLAPSDAEPKDQTLQRPPDAVPARLCLRIKIDDVGRFITDPNHAATVQGFVECDLLGGRLEVERGSFNLLVDTDAPARKEMHYNLCLQDRTDGRVDLHGTKVVQDDPGFDVWLDTSTLHVRVMREANQPGVPYEPLASGIVRIHLLDFLRQLTTFRASGPTSADRIAALTRFGRLFLGKLWDVYARDVLTAAPF